MNIQSEPIIDASGSALRDRGGHAPSIADYLVRALSVAPQPAQLLGDNSFHARADLAMQVRGLKTLSDLSTNEKHTAMNAVEVAYSAFAPEVVAAFRQMLA